MDTSYILRKLNGAEFKIWRLQDAPLRDTVTLDTPQAIVDYLTPMLEKSLTYRPDVENFIVVHLNVRRKPIGFEVISNGTLDTLLVHAREVFKSAILANSHSIVCVDNHPSGDPTPSEADIKVTRDMIRAGQLLRIEITDHIILGRATELNPQSWKSLRELGYFCL